MRRPRSPPGGRTPVLGPPVRPKGSEEGGDAAAPSHSHSLALALPLSRSPKRSGAPPSHRRTSAMLARCPHNTATQSTSLVASPPPPLPRQPAVVNVCAKVKWHFTSPSQPWPVIIVARSWTAIIIAPLTFPFLSYLSP